MRHDIYLLFQYLSNIPWRIRINIILFFTLSLPKDTIFRSSLPSPLNPYRFTCIVCTSKNRPVGILYHSCYDCCVLSPMQLRFQNSSSHPSYGAGFSPYLSTHHNTENRAAPHRHTKNKRRKNAK